MSIALSAMSSQEDDNRKALDD